MMEASIPGAIVGIWGPAGDYVRTFGVADQATRSPMQTDFYTRIDSITKTFTVTAILQLVDQGKLKPDDAEHVNPNGRAIALDHPLGASGARRADCRARTAGPRRPAGLTTMCTGVEQGTAVTFETA